MSQATSSGSERILPWHRLGSVLPKNATVDDMLDISQCNYDVFTANVAAVDSEGNMLYGSNGKPIIIEDSRATIQSNADGSFRGISTVGTRYVVQQNREVLERAVSVAHIMRGMKDDADIHIDACGSIGNGREFFASIHVGTSLIDPHGIADQLDDYLIVRNGHDGKTPITFANTPIRVICKNSILVAVGESGRRVTARHTKNADFVVSDGREVARQWIDLSRKTKQIAERLVKIDVTNNDTVVQTAMSVLRRGAGKRSEKHLDVAVDSIVKLYSSNFNSARYGKNAWSLYNSVVEYLDHQRDATPEDRAETTMDPTSWVSKKKLATVGHLLALATR